MEKQQDFTKPEYYENRELSWLKFNHRVLNEARDKSLPLLERLKFVSITSSNLDEFFMVRVASLKDMVHANYKKRDIAGMTATEQLDAINERTRELVSLQYNTYNRSLVPLMNQNGIYIVDAYEELTEAQSEYVDRYFEDNVYPVLTPMAVDASRPFPLIRNKTLNIAALLSKKKEKSGKEQIEFATVQVPGVLPRFIQIPGEQEEDKVFVLLEQVIEKNIAKLFLNYEVVCAYPYRVMRNADLSIDEDEASDLLKEIQKQLKMRQWGEVIRLEVEDGINKKLLNFLKAELKVADQDVFQINGPIDLTFLMKMYGLKGCDHLRNEPYVPQRVPEIAPGENIFDAIRKGDILLHHPYQTFDPVVDFIRQASVDPDVLAIKQTLYRVSGNSPIIASLAQAAENGKQVSVLVELKARFDEENNIVWAKKLEQAGCHVIYGLVGLKTHSKIALVVRREEDGIRRYVHLGTGNYNESTSKLYTDLSLMTASEEIGHDASVFFHNLATFNLQGTYDHLLVAPSSLQDGIIKRIEREKMKAESFQPCGIFMKMNSLTDRKIIDELSKASNAGVPIFLLIRGICCIRPGIPGKTENIRVESIVGRFLEHSRIYAFGVGDDTEIYISSADMMTRNTRRRVEVAAPIYDPRLKQRILKMIDVMKQDNIQAQVLLSNGEYTTKKKREDNMNSQIHFLNEARRLAPKEKTPKQNLLYQVKGIFFGKKKLRKK